MFRHSFVLVLGLSLAGPASAAGWADALFEEHQCDFGPVSRGSQLQHSFHLTNTTGQPVTIGGARVSCGCTSAVVLNGRLNPGDSTVVQATMDSGRFSGSKTVTIYINFTAPQFDEVRLSVTANSREDLNLTPDVLAFGKVKQGSSPSASVTITLYGDSRTQITGVQCDSSFVQPVVKEARRTVSDVAYQLDARLSEKTPAGKWYSDVWLQTTNPSMPRIRVPLTIEIEPAVPPAKKVVAGQVKSGSPAQE